MSISTDAKLILNLPNNKEQVFTLTGSNLTLGRDESNDIVLADEKVSRLHAHLEFDNGAWTLVDAGSANGIVVEGQRVDRILLRSGAQIKVGNSALRFEQKSADTSFPAQTKSRRPARGSADHQLLSQFLDDLEHNKSEQAAAKTTPLRDKLLRVPRLVISTPQNTWGVRLSDQDSWTIGRSADNDIVINHQKVSRRHAQIERRQDRYIIRDLGSANGVWLGRQQLQTHTLHHTDTLTIGHAQLTFKDAGQIDKLFETKSKSTRTPVIIVPGFFGSTLWRESEQVWPSIQTILRTPEKLYYAAENLLEARSIVDEVAIVPKLVEIEAYSRIGDYLEESLNYTRGRDLLEFAYDWRIDIQTAAQKLAETIERWNVSGPVTIIAHSLGCLVSRYYVDCMGGDQHIKRLILIGGPNYGSPYTFLTLLAGKMSHLRTPVFSLGGAFGEKIMQAFISFPNSYQTLPVYPAIFDQHKQPINLYNEDVWLPTEKSRYYLQTGRDLHKNLSKQATVSTICIFGYGFKTVTQLDIVRDSSNGWRELAVTTTNDGDGTVPTHSAVLEGAEIHPVHQSHNQLYVDEDVLMRLKYELIN